MKKYMWGRRRTWYVRLWDALTGRRSRVVEYESKPITRSEARYILMTVYDGDMAARGKRPDISLTMAQALCEAAEG